MENKLVKIGTIGFIIVAMVMTLIAIMSVSSSRVGASAPAGLPATLATSTLLGLNVRTATTLIATSSCSARIITTSASPLMLTFSDYNNAAPTGQFGHLQAASTTVVYDSGQYGCGLVKAFADTATTITFTETR